MPIPSICPEPVQGTKLLCGGKIVKVRGTYKCERCKVLYDGNPEALAFLNAQGRQAEAIHVLSSLSRRADVPEQPTRLADILPIPADAENHCGYAPTPHLVYTLEGDSVELPAVASVDRLSQINFDLRRPRQFRLCSNRDCLDLTAAPDQDGKRPRNKLYHQKPDNMEVLPPNCRLEEEKDATTGDTIVYLVPDKGFCRKCGTPFDFLPIAKDTMIGEHRIEGPFCAGGDGMLYHAFDTELNRPVVIKALHNASDLKGAEIASQELGALLRLQGQPGVLQVVGFKTYMGRPLIILEWLDGEILFDIRQKNKGPLPVEVGLSYLMGAAAALLAGHQLNPSILHLDGKPQNFMALAPGDRLKAIDYGGSQSEGRPGQAVAVTEGFSAPELYREHALIQGKLRRPSKASDVFAAGKVWVFLCLDSIMNGKYRFAVPTPAEESLFSALESLYRFVLRMTAYNPDERMSMAEVLIGAAALRKEVIALKQRRAMPSVSAIFAPDLSKDTELNYRNLPRLAIAAKDPAARLVEAALDKADPNEQRALLEQALIEHPESKAARLSLAALSIDTGDLTPGRQLLEEMTNCNCFDCRPVYELARLALAEGDVQTAARLFDACYSVWPWETAIKLPNGLCRELLGDYAGASRFYETVAWVDPDYTAAPFRWAHCAEMEGDWATAIEAYNRVPRSSWAYTKAVAGKVRALLKVIAGAGTAGGAGLVELKAAADACAFVIARGASLDSFLLQAEVLETAIALLRARTIKSDKSIFLFGIPLVQKRLRDSAEQCLIRASECVANREERIQLVDRARTIRRVRITRIRLF